MVEAFAVLLGAVAIGSIGLALAPLRRRSMVPETSEDPATSDLIAAREAALQTIRDLEFDYELGNLSDADYHQVREQHKREAIALLRATNGRPPEGEDPIDAAIEAAIARVRERRRRLPVGAETVNPDGLPAAAARRQCTHCGRLAEPSDRYCAACGERLPHACPSCGQVVRAEAQFCPHCGYSLADGVAPLASAASEVDVRASVAPSSIPAQPPGSPRDAARSMRHPLAWLIGGGGAVLAVVAGVSWLYLAGRSLQGDQQPWAQLPASVQDFHSLAFVPGRTGSALFGYHGGLLASEDGGRSWQGIGVQGDAMAIVVSTSRPGVIYAAGHDVFVRSSDGGQSWAAVAHDLPSSDVHALAEDPDNPQTLYAIVAGNGLFRSEDGGTRWTLIGSQVPQSATGLARMSAGHPSFYLATVDQGVLSSTDGRAWANANGFVNGALPTLRINALVFDQQSGDRYVMASGAQMAGALYAGTDRGLFKSIDGGNSWNRLPLQSDVSAVAIDATNSQVLLVVDSRGRLFRSSDRGVSWKGG